MNNYNDYNRNVGIITIIIINFSTNIFQNGDDDGHNDDVDDYGGLNKSSFCFNFCFRKHHSSIKLIIASIKLSFNKC